MDLNQRAKRQIKPPQYLNEYELQENPKTTNDFKKSKSVQKSKSDLKSSEASKKSPIIATDNLQIIPDIENSNNDQMDNPMEQGHEESLHTEVDLSNNESKFY